MAGRDILLMVSLQRAGHSRDNLKIEGAGEQTTELRSVRTRAGSNQGGIKFLKMKRYWSEILGKVIRI
jgi:hypothetical protein